MRRSAIRYTKSVVFHFSKTISQAMTFWELGLGLFGIRVIQRGKLGFMAVVRVGEMVLEKCSGVQSTKSLSNAVCQTIIQINFLR